MMMNASVFIRLACLGMVLALVTSLLPVARVSAQADAPAAETTVLADSAAAPVDGGAERDGVFGFFCINPLWLILFIVCMYVWLLFTGWVSNDALGIGMDFRMNAAMMLGAGLPGLALALLFHVAFVLLMPILVISAFVGYVLVRNERVPTDHRLFGPEHRARLALTVPLLGKFLNTEVDAGYEGGAAVPLTNAKGMTIDDMLTQRPEMTPSVAMFTQHIVRAAAVEATQVQVLPASPEEYVVRYLLDGVLHSVEAVPADVARNVIVAVSLFAGLTKDERMQPGEAVLTAELTGHPGAEVLVRVGILKGQPSLIFVLPSWSQTLHENGLESIGMHDSVVKRVLGVLEGGHGAIIVCSPPGCGKTTTVYSVAAAVDFFTTDIYIIEPEEELPIEHVRRFLTPPGKSFTAFYESVLREAPQDLVFASLDTPEHVQCALKFAKEEGVVIGGIVGSSAAETLLRLVRMAGDAETVAGSVACVLAQQLVRRVCPDCRQVIEPSAEYLQKIGIDPASPGLWHQAVGCPNCLGSGYRGRIALFSLLIVTEEVREVLRKPRPSAAAIRKAAGKAALRTLFQDGLSKVTAGVTTVAEVRRVLGKK
jgi:general secretion pathway protein E